MYNHMIHTCNQYIIIYIIHQSGGLKLMVCLRCIAILYLAMSGWVNFRADVLLVHAWARLVMIPTIDSPG
jgi:hypothetical protein